MSRNPTTVITPNREVDACNIFPAHLHRHDDSFIAQVDQALQQGGRFGTAVAHVVYAVFSCRTTTGQRKAKSVFAVVLRFDHVVHGRSSGSHRKCTARQEHGGVETCFTGAFSEEQCMICCDDVRSVGERVREVREQR